MPIIISKNEKDAKRVERTSFEKGEDLLRYISNNPNCIPLEETKENIQFVIGGINFKEKFVLDLKLS